MNRTLRLSALLCFTTALGCPADPPADTGDTATTQATLVDRCDEAVASAPLTAGSYSGDTSAWTDAADTECFGVDTGPEAFATVEVPAGALLIADARLEVGDAMVYAFDACANTSTCLSSADAMIAGEGEHLTWFNDASDTASVLLGLDSSADSEAGAWTLGLALIEDVATATPADDCAAALGAPTLSPGWYRADLRGTTALFDPREGNDCTGYSALSPEGLFPVMIPAGATLTVRGAASPQADVSVYLLTDCADLNTCVAGSDNGEPETFTYSNDGAEALRAYVVADGWGYEGDPLDVFFEVALQ